MRAVLHASLVRTALAALEEEERARSVAKTATSRAEKEEAERQRTKYADQAISAKYRLRYLRRDLREEGATPPHLPPALGDVDPPEPDTDPGGTPLKGSTYRRCSCRDPKTGNELGSSCPKRKSRKHGYYSIRQELPPREDGTRRSFSRAGYESLKDAQADLDHVRSLLALADEDDPDSLQRLVAMLEEVAAEKAPLPAIEETQRRLRAGLALRGSLTVGEWPDQ